MMRIGIGHDSHRLEAGGPLRLGGIDIPHDKHAVGHSDADVLLHAVLESAEGEPRASPSRQWAGILMGCRIEIEPSDHLRTRQT